MTLSDDIIVDSFTNRPSANCSLMCLWGCIQRKVLDDTRVYFEQLLFASTDLEPGRSPPSCLLVYLVSAFRDKPRRRLDTPGDKHIPFRKTCAFLAIALAKDFCCHRACKRLSLPSRFQKTFVAIALSKDFVDFVSYSLDDKPLELGQLLKHQETFFWIATKDKGQQISTRVIQTRQGWPGKHQVRGVWDIGLAQRVLLLPPLQRLHGWQGIHTGWIYNAKSWRRKRLPVLSIIILMHNNTQDGDNIICPECARKKMIEEIEEQ